jgi:3-oxoacyl-[acyl-carrier-protein] synthase III
MSTLGISSIGIALGEQELAPADLALEYGMTEAAVLAALDGMIVHATSRSMPELACEAATRCLERASLSAQDVDLLITCRTLANPHLGAPLEVLLGRPDIVVMSMTGNCSVFFQAMWMARAWLLTQGMRRALVVYSETCAEATRIPGPLIENAPRDIFSDAAGAVLIEEGGGLALRSYGAAQNAEWWSYFTTYGAGGVDGRELDVLRGSMEVCKLALRRTLDGAGYSIDQIDAFAMPNEVGVLMRWIERHLRIPFARVVQVPRAPSHAWAIDPIYNLQHLMSTGNLAPGSRIVCLSRAIGSAGALALEVVG